MEFTTLITCGELGAAMATGSCVIVDCRFDLGDIDAGRRLYVASHIPKAVYVHLDNDLSGVKTGTNGRHPLPPPDVLQRKLSRLGIGNGTQVVAYDEGSGMYASRLWWMLRWIGHEAAAVLDGGFARWVAEGHSTSAGVETNAPREHTGSPRSELTVDADTVARRAADGDWRVIDARAPERYRGELEPLDRVAGHIPGAVNHFYKANLTKGGVFRSPAELRERFGSVLGGASPEHVVCYCGSGVTACHNLLALEHAGMYGAKLYPGSWSEWSADETRPVERG